MKSLDQIAIEMGADKASIHPVKGHGYAVHYDAVFSTMRNNPIKICEVGVGSAESMRTWLEYFPKAQVHGVDIVHDTNPWNTEGSKPHPRYTFTPGDQGSAEFWKEFVARHGSDWDIFVDDGSHMIWHVFLCFELMWPHIKPSGHYAIEDLGVGEGAGSVFVRAGMPRHMEWIGQLVGQMTRGENGIGKIYQSEELAILQKKAQPVFHEPVT